MSLPNPLTEQSPTRSSSSPSTSNLPSITDTSIWKVQTKIMESSPQSSFSTRSTETSTSVDRNLVLITSTISPPTPAPSPRPHNALPTELTLPTLQTVLPWIDLPNSPTSPGGSETQEKKDYSIMSPSAFVANLLNLSARERHLFLRDLLANLPPPDLRTLSQLLSPLLKRDFIKDLPAELALRIFHFVSEDPRSLARCAQVSRVWRNIVTDDEIWRVMCRRRGFDGTRILSSALSDLEDDGESESTSEEGGDSNLRMNMDLDMDMDMDLRMGSESEGGDQDLTDATSTSNLQESEEEAASAAASATGSSMDGERGRRGRGGTSSTDEDDSTFESDSEEEVNRVVTVGDQQVEGDTERDRVGEIQTRQRAETASTLRQEMLALTPKAINTEHHRIEENVGGHDSDQEAQSMKAEKEERELQGQSQPEGSDGSDSTAEESLIASKVLRGSSPTLPRSPRNNAVPIHSRSRSRPKSMPIHRAVSQSDIYRFAESSNQVGDQLSAIEHQNLKVRGYTNASQRPLPPFSYKSHFKRAYLTESAWLRGPGRLITTQVASDDAVVTCLGFDDDWIVLGMTNSQIHIFDATTGQYVRSLQGHEQGVWCLTLVSGNGRISGKKETSPSWSTARRSSKTFQLKLPKSEPEREKIEILRDSRSAIWKSPNLRQATSAGPSSPSNRPMTRNQRRSSFQIPQMDATPIAATNGWGGMGIGAGGPTGFSPQQSVACNIVRGWGQKNTIVVSGGCDRDVRVWDVCTGANKHILRGHTSTVRCLKVLEGRPIAISGSRDTTMRVWDIEKGVCKRILVGHEHSVRAMEVFGNQVVSGSYDCTARLFDVDTGKCLFVYRGHFHQIYSVGFDGEHVATGSLDSTVRVWSARTGGCLAVLQGHTSLVGQLVLTPDVLVTGGSDGRVIVFSLSTLQTIHRICAHDNSVTCLQVDSRFIVTGGNDGKIKLFDLKTGAFVRELTDEGKEGAVWRVVFRDDKWVVVSRREGKTVLDVRSFRPLE